MTMKQYVIYQDCPNGEYKAISIIGTETPLEIEALLPFNINWFRSSFVLTVEDAIAEAKHRGYKYKDRNEINVLRSKVSDLRCQTQELIIDYWIGDN